LENRFLGLYAPSAGTIYPRLQRMEAEGLVTHTAAGGRKVYEITDAGQQELRHRAGELASLEADIHASVADLSSLASEIQNEVRGSVRDIKRELREQARQARSRRWEPEPSAQRWRPSEEAVALEQRASELAAEARRLARRPGATDEVLETARAAIDAALAVIRRF
jgi:DNA-binding PadR family transcriptional regulator